MVKKPKAPPPGLIQQTEQQYGASFKTDLFEQYKFYVASAEKVSERRVTANNYRFTTLIHEIANSSPFRTRRGDP